MNWTTREERTALKNEVEGWRAQGRTQKDAIKELAIRGIDAWYSVCAARLGYSEGLIIYHTNGTEQENDIAIIGEWK